jgi:hypothetical protein
MEVEKPIYWMPFITSAFHAAITVAAMLKM